ncbi:hypothetical protein E4L95_08455 [Paracoccus liaowanqingii]|uniref:Uncharacterized protein n=2 Tax=Paracoccus liaowanqingii TaxID=2560053 RepID=A0A4Z1C0R4_9RHOB|nr:hypothetical protein E4L95_08455 [Paracoccus liaowanqingii]
MWRWIVEGRMPAQLKLYSGAVNDMDKRAMLIAELDEESRVAWLWRADPGKRPKPVKNAAACLQELDSLILFGAPKPEIEAWLREQSDQQATFPREL